MWRSRSAGPCDWLAWGPRSRDGGARARGGRTGRPPPPRSPARPVADMVEGRLDAAPSVGPEQVGGGAKGPLIAACRAARDGGLFHGREEERVALLARAAATGRFRLDVERGSAAERLQESAPAR